MNMYEMMRWDLFKEQTEIVLICAEVGCTIRVDI